MTEPHHELPELDAAAERDLELALRHAFLPSAIDPARHERLLQTALIDPFAEASDEERAAGEQLRQALEGEGDDQDLRLARALSAAHRPHQAALPATIGNGGSARRARSGKISLARFGTLAASLALAAALLLLLVRPSWQGARATPHATLELTTLAQSRSTAPLFVEGDAGSASARIDLIAGVRARDLRGNRFAAWGVR